MATDSLSTTELMKGILRVLEGSGDSPLAADEIAAAVGADCDAVQAALLVLSADGRIEIEQQDGRMVVTAVAPPEETPTELPPAIRTLERIAAAMSTLERVAAVLRRVMWWAPFVGMAAGALLGACLSDHDRALSAVCLGVFGGVIGFMLKDSFGPRTWLDWLR